MSKKFKYRRLRLRENEDSGDRKQDGGYFGDRPKRTVTPEQKKEYLHLFLYLLLWSVLTSSIYYTCTVMEFFPIVPAYAVLGAVLFLVYVYFNGGVKRINPENFEKPEDMGFDEFTKLIGQIKNRQKKSKYFLILFIPFPMILLMDYVIIVWSGKISG